MSRLFAWICMPSRRFPSNKLACRGTDVLCKALPFAPWEPCILGCELCRFFACMEPTSPWIYLPFLFRRNFTWNFWRVCYSLVESEFTKSPSHLWKWFIVLKAQRLLDIFTLLQRIEGLVSCFRERIVAMCRRSPLFWYVAASTFLFRDWFLFIRVKFIPWPEQVAHSVETWLDEKIGSFYHHCSF